MVKTTLAVGLRSNNLSAYIQRRRLAVKKFFSVSLAAVAVVVAAPSIAQVKTTTDNSGSYNTGDRARSQTNVTVYNNSHNNVSAGVSGSTTYQQPSQGGQGPQQGTQRGSTSDTTGGVFIRKSF